MWCGRLFQTREAATGKAWSSTAAVAEIAVVVVEQKKLMVQFVNK